MSKMAKYKDRDQKIDDLLEIDNLPHKINT